MWARSIIQSAPNDPQETAVLYQYLTHYTTLDQGEVHVCTLVAFFSVNQGFKGSVVSNSGYDAISSSEPDLPYICHICNRKGHIEVWGQGIRLGMFDDDSNFDPAAC
jgi:hypothetical protein